MAWLAHIPTGDGADCEEAGPDDLPTPAASIIATDGSGALCSHLVRSEVKFELLLQCQAANQASISSTNAADASSTTTGIVPTSAAAVMRRLTHLESKIDKILQTVSPTPNIGSINTSGADSDSSIAGAHGMIALIDATEGQLVPIENIGKLRCSVCCSTVPTNTKSMPGVFQYCFDGDNEFTGRAMSAEFRHLKYSVRQHWKSAHHQRRARLTEQESSLKKRLEAEA